MESKVSWLASPLARVLSVAAGMGLVLVGSWYGTMANPQGVLGVILALLGVPLILSGLFDWHPLALALGQPARGADLRDPVDVARRREEEEASLR